MPDTLRAVVLTYPGDTDLLCSVTPGGDGLGTQLSISAAAIERHFGLRKRTLTIEYREHKLQRVRDVIVLPPEVLHALRCLHGPLWSASIVCAVDGDRTPEDADNADDEVSDDDDPTREQRNMDLAGEYDTMPPKKGGGAYAHTMFDDVDNQERYNYVRYGDRPAPPR